MRGSMSFVTNAGFVDDEDIFSGFEDFLDLNGVEGGENLVI